MEEVKRKRGRPRKNPIPEEVKEIIQAPQQEIIPKQEITPKHKQGEWDVKIGESIPYFDKRLSYELTGYKPITETEGLDFRPEWFTEARKNKLETGHYTSYYFGSKAYRDFWNEEYKRCREGLTVNGYTLTGPHYFFLNYYQLPNPEAKKAGTSRSEIFPNFYSYQYEFFHYYELCRILHKNCGLMKSRGIGFSEINAAILANIYSCFSESNTLLTAFSSNYVEVSLQKVWNELSFLNDETDGGFFKLRQVVDTTTRKRASFYKIINGQKVEDGWMAQIEGIVAEKDSKIRGNRTDLLILEEAGSNPIFTKSFVKAEALTTLGGNKIGIIMAGGTGGDKGPSLKGLRDMYYEPSTLDVLPFLHNYNDKGEWKETAFFIPAYTALYKSEFVDDRGVCIQAKAKEYFKQEWKKREQNPQKLIDYKAEFCFTAEEAFLQEGVNSFNKVKIVEQITNIRLLKKAPEIQRGYMEFLYSDPNHKRQSISGVRFKPHPEGPVHILQHPLWEISTGQDKEPNETDEDYQNRKKLEDAVSFSKMSNLYVAGIDGIDLGQVDTSDYTKNPSKFCTMIKRRIHGMKDPIYVAYYMDRPQRIEEAYEQTLALMYYYNAIGNLEASKVGILTWAKREKWMNYFMRRPRVCSGDPNKRRSGTTPYGTTTTVAMIQHGIDLVASYIEDYYYNIWFIELLEQLESYTDENKGQFDMVAACQMAEIADEELSEMVPVAIKPIAQEFQDIGYYKDEKGYTRFGVIPKNNVQANFTFEKDYYDSTISSNPLYR